MSQEKTLLEETINALMQQRDELGLQIHLGAAEAKEEFEKAKGKLDQMTSEFEPVKDAMAESAGNVFTALQLVGDEIVASFERIRKSLE